MTDVPLVVDPIADHSLLQRRTLVTLRLAQVPGQAAVAGVVAVGALLAKDLLHGQDRFAGSGGAAFTLGSAFLAVPLSAFMRRNGRRPGLKFAFGLGAVGAVIAGIGGQLRSFPLFLLGMLCFGGAQAATLQGRYVAADLARESDRAQAIASVVVVGTLGAVFGPVLTPWEKRAGQAVGLDQFIGPFFFAALLLLVAMAVIARRLHPDPLAVNGELDPHAERVRPLRQVRISAAVIRSNRLATLGLVAMVVSQTTMVAVMTMTPSHMKDHNQADLSAYVIALHIAGMYAFAPFVGRFVGRVGQVPAVMVGSVVLGAGTVVSVVAGYVPSLIFVGLFLLGVGWNIGLIAGSSMLTGAVPGNARVEVQGTADLTMSFCGGMAAFASGFVKQAWGFHMLANAATLLAGLLLVVAYTHSLRTRLAVH
ncbi:MAG: MFS transporter [Ilumatobacteraceae bacterium]|nr:MFS transporter [Ilumatobacteraceae bacterium]MBP7887629.1 MFS transporter [Ilumatobacteraceae bacterium]MBP8207977.1 MFS transporter [Ilumatobacteraceae bacterium]